MSYEKAMNHSRNHHKDRFFQQCGGPSPDAFTRPNNPVPYVDALQVLDEMDKYRRDCNFKGSTDMDFAVRKACQIIASAAGYADRTSWIEAIHTATTMDIPHVEGKAVALTCLRDIEGWRVKHSTNPQSIDYALRYAEAVVAHDAGFKERTDWTDALKQDPKATYSRDYFDPEYPTWVW